MATNTEDFSYLNLSFADEMDSSVSGSEKRNDFSIKEWTENVTENSHHMKVETQLHVDNLDSNGITQAFHKEENATTETVREDTIVNEDFAETTKETGVRNDESMKTRNGRDTISIAKVRQACGDKIFRAKMIRTCFILWNCTVFGWTFGMSGPTLPDLQLITGSNLQQASWLFTGFNIGYLVSCATSGFVHRKIHPDLLFFLYTTCHGFAVGTLPWIPSIYAMVAIRGVLGYCCGGQDIEIHSMMFAVWQSDAGPFLQMVHFLFGLGGILSPLVSNTFSIKSVRSARTENGANESWNNQSNISLSVWPTVNCNAVATHNGTGISSEFSHFESAGIITKETHVQFAYLINAFLAFSAAMPFIVLFLTSGRQEQKEEIQSTKIAKKITGRIQFLVVILLCIISAVGTALLDSFPSYLSTFGLLQLEWPQNIGSSMTSLFFAMYAVGNLLGVFILRFISSRSFIYLSYISGIGSILLFYIGIWWTITPLQTIPVAVIGLTTSAILPTIFTWTQEAVCHVSGVVASAFLFAGSVGAMANPVLLGFLMESVTPMWFLYLTILEISFCFTIFIIAALIIRKFSIPNM